LIGLSGSGKTLLIKEFMAGENREIEKEKYVFLVKGPGEK
jgi:GTPase SAR1 family protein